MNRKIVYNACYGGFGLSPLATKMLYEIKYPEETVYFYERNFDPNMTIFKKVNLNEIEKFPTHKIILLSKDLGDEFIINNKDTTSELFKDFDQHFIWIPDIERHDPDLIKVVETLKDKASSDCSKLLIADIGESKYHIDSNDGYETIITDTEIDDNYWL